MTAQLDLMSVFLNTFKFKPSLRFYPFSRSPQKGKVWLTGIKRALLALALLGFIPSLQADDNTNAAANSAGEHWLVTVTDQVILPLYRDLETQAVKLVTSSKNFCQQPNNEQLQQLRQAWLNTMLAWQRTDSLMFGPAIEEQLDFHINFTPPKKLIIKQLLNSDQPITGETLNKNGVGGKGLSTLEYLLYDRERSDADLLQDYVPENSAAQRRCAYLQEVSELLHSDIQRITTPWLRTQNSYADSFRTAGAGSPMFVSQQEAIDTLISKLYQSAEKTTGRRLAKPLGIRTKQAPKPYQLEAWRSGASMALVKANLQGIKMLLVDGGILAHLTTQSTAAKHTAQSLAQALDKAMTLDVPADAFSVVDSGNSTALLPWYEQSQIIKNIIKNEVAAELGVQLGFNDNDGD